ncbi:MAG: DUF1365 domain-containing protein, partial [Micrococcales bacterium]|nr:DUF1365 domain-containing protein [Micrococcales bacterium]
TPLRHAFTNAYYQWLVDLDAIPEFRWPTSLLARFDAKDHLDRGRLGGGIRGDIERFLAGRGITLEPTDRVLMLANARVLGHTFDPLSVYWCLGADDTLKAKALVFEVHNTYGERHAYLLDLDEWGRASVEKTFYVSPFNDVSGTYTVKLRLQRSLVAVSVGLDRDGERVMTAATTGRPVDATAGSLVRTSARHLFMTQRVSLLIRWHGIRLWLRRLPVLPRPRHTKEAVR